MKVGRVGVPEHSRLPRPGGRREQLREPQRPLQISREDGHVPHGEGDAQVVRRPLQSRDDRLDRGGVGLRVRAERLDLERPLGRGAQRHELVCKRVELDELALECGQPRQVDQRGRVGRLEEEHALERIARCGEAPGTQRIRVEEDLDQVEPGLDVVRVGAEDRSVPLLRFGVRPRSPDEEGFEETPILLGQPSRVPERQLRLRPGEAVLEIPLGRHAQPVVRQGEQAVFSDGSLERLDSGTELTTPQQALPFEKRLVRREVRGRHGGDPLHPRAGAGPR